MLDIHSWPDASECARKERDPSLFLKKIGEEILTLTNANTYSLSSLILVISNELLTQWISSSREISC